MAKVFGTNLNFSDTMDTQMKMMPKGENIGMSGKIFFANGNSRTELDMTEMKGGKMTPQALTQIKSMGMDKIVSISQTDKKVIYMIYPGLQAYAKIELPNAKSVQTNDFKVESVRLGKETLDGHPSVKIKYTLNNMKTVHRLTMTAGNAPDLKKCRVKIDQSNCIR